MIKYLMVMSIKDKTNLLWTLYLSCKHQYWTKKKTSGMEHYTKLIQSYIIKKKT